MYQNEDINKSKRISWLSIFSTICQSKLEGGKKSLVDMAFEINDQLYEKYPFVEQPQQTQTKPYMQNNSQKQKPTKCPNCSQMSFYHNTGVSTKSGKPIPWENYKCSKCKHIEWISKNYSQKNEEWHQQNNDLDLLEENHFKENEIPPEYK